MKDWNVPEIEELEVCATAGGGSQITDHDGVYNTTAEGLVWEGYSTAS